MSETNVEQKQEENTVKLVMNTYYKVMKDNGATAEDVSKYLQEKYGDVWKLTTLTEKAERALARSATLGFLKKNGDRYVAKLVRSMCTKRPSCRRRRRRRRSCRRRRRCGRKRRSRSRRRRRRRPCGCS